MFTASSPDISVTFSTVTKSSFFKRSFQRPTSFEGVAALART
jgi:hypothetical protein